MMGKIILLGYEVGHGIRTPPINRVEKVTNAPRPKTKREVSSFLGLTGFYRDHIPNYAAIASPLTDLLRKGQPNKVEWEDAQECAYQSLKRSITERPISQQSIRTDASDAGIGAIL